MQKCGVGSKGARALLEVMEKSGNLWRVALGKNIPGLYYVCTGCVKMYFQACIHVDLASAKEKKDQVQSDLICFLPDVSIRSRLDTLNKERNDSFLRFCDLQLPGVPILVCGCVYCMQALMKMGA